jgi:hypothetical protein
LVNRAFSDHNPDLISFFISVGEKKTNSPLHEKTEIALNLSFTDPIQNNTDMQPPPKENGPRFLDHVFGIRESIGSQCL